jgi:hypothetical protein
MGSKSSLPAAPPPKVSSSKHTTGPPSSDVSPASNATNKQFVSPSTLDGPLPNTRSVLLDDPSNPNLTPLGKRRSPADKVNVDPTSDEEDYVDEVDSLVNDWEQRMVIDGQKLEDEGTAYYDKVHATISFMGPFTSHGNDKVQAFFSILSPEWYQRATFALVNKIVHVVFHDERDIHDGVEWLQSVNPTIASFFSNNTKVDEVIRESNEFVGFGLPRRLEAEEAFDLLINQMRIPQEGLVRIGLFVNEAGPSGGFLLEYSQAPLLLHRVNMTRGVKTQFTMGNLRVSMNESFHGPVWLCHRCRNCNKSHPLVRCSFRYILENGKTIKMANPQAPKTPCDDIVVEYINQTRQRAFQRNEIIPPLNEAIRTAVEDEAKRRKKENVDIESETLIRRIDKRIKDIRKKSSSRTKGKNDKSMEVDDGEMRSKEFPTLNPNKHSKGKDDNIDANSTLADSKKEKKVRRRKGRKRKLEEEFDKMDIDDGVASLTPSKSLPSQTSTKPPPSVPKSVPSPVAKPHPPLQEPKVVPPPVVKPLLDTTRASAPTAPAQSTKATRSNMGVSINLFELDDPKKRKRNRTITENIESESRRLDIRKPKLPYDPTPPVKRMKNIESNQEVIVTKIVISDESIKEMPCSIQPRSSVSQGEDIDISSPKYSPYSPSDWLKDNGVFSDSDVSVITLEKASGVSTPDTEI